MAQLSLIIAIDLVMCVIGAHGVTLKEGLANPQKYIMYDTSEFSIPMHAGIALLQSYVILAIVIGGVFLVGKLTGRKKPMRSVVIGDEDPPTKSAIALQNLTAPTMGTADGAGFDPGYSSNPADDPYAGYGGDGSYSQQQDPGYDAAAASYSQSQGPADPYAGYGTDPYDGYGNDAARDQRGY